MLGFQQEEHQVTIAAMSDKVAKHPATPFPFGAQDICFPDSTDQLLNTLEAASSPASPPAFMTPHQTLWLLL